MRKQEGGSQCSVPSAESGALQSEEWAVVMAVLSV